MTLAPHGPPNLRFVLALLAIAVCVGFGVLTLLTFGVGPSLFLFALAAVGVVDLVVLSRRRGGRDVRIE